MSISTRVVLFTMLVSILAGILVAAISLLLGEPRAMVHSLTSGSLLLELFAIAVFATLPISIPFGALGAFVATRELKRPRPASFTTRVRRGCVWGSLLGSLAAVIWIFPPYVWFGRKTPEATFILEGIGSSPVEILLGLSECVLIGAITGGPVGMFVAWYCNRISRTKVGPVDS